MRKEDKKKGQKFSIPEVNIADVIQQKSKYQIGEKGYDFYSIRSLKPTFAFDYLALNNSDLCFNRTGLVVKDYVGLLEGLKKISSKTYKELSEIPNYRFHPINFEDNVSISRKQFKAVLVPREDLLSDEELPTLYQFDLQYVQKARVCGFLFRGVFYLIWYDRNHEIYS